MAKTISDRKSKHLLYFQPDITRRAMNLASLLSRVRGTAWILALQFQDVAGESSFLTEGVIGAEMLRNID